MTRFGMTPKQRDILLIPIPFTDLQAVKRRPVIVLSNDQYNKVTQDIIVAAITSNVQDNAYGIIIDSLDVQNGILKHRSQIRADKIYTLNKRIILKRFGRLKLEKYRDLLSAIKKLIE